MSRDEMRMMSKSPHGKHFKSGKNQLGFIDVVEKDPPKDYEGRHWMRSHPELTDEPEQVWMGCRACVMRLESAH